MAVIDVNDRTWREIQALRANIAGDANDGKRLQIAVHIAELDHLADRVLIGPPLASQKFADYGNMRRTPMILFAENPPADQRNAQGTEVVLAGHTIKGVSDLGRILRHTLQFIEIDGRLSAIEDDEASVSEIVSGGDGHRTGQTHALYAVD